MELFWLTIKEAHEGLKSKRFSSEELTKACLERIRLTEPQLNNFITLTEEEALISARRTDAKIALGEPIGPLEGIPASMKDLFNTKGIRTTCASRMLQDFIPPYESTPTGKLQKAGYVLLGKNNLDEFACGVSTEHSAFGPSKNPWDLEMVPGGSSGGSTSAVASGQAFYSLGTDTGGSIRLPAAFCGVVGLKVTYGRVSRFGVTAMASSLDTIGPITRSVEDAALVLQAIAGHDPLDSTTGPVPVPNYSEALSKGISGLRIGVPEEYFGEGVDPEVADLVRKAISEYEKWGATIVPLSLPLTKYGVAIYYILCPAELSTNLSRYDGVRFGHSVEGGYEDIHDYYTKVRGEAFGDEIKRRIIIGSFVLSAGYADAFYRKALKVRTKVLEEFSETFKQVDVLIAPAAPSAAFKLGSKVDDPLAMYMVDALTIPASVAGLPSLAVPCGFTKSGLPVGFQIMGPHWSEDRLLSIGAAYEQNHDFKDRHPTL